MLMQTPNLSILTTFSRCSGSLLGWASC